VNKRDSVFKRNAVGDGYISFLGEKVEDFAEEKEVVWVWM
jgi:hypothetical protein